MNELKLLFDNFETLADAPNGIKGIRETILQLAVQGKLVPQDPNGEPASVLLQKIKAEKEKLIKEKKIKKGKPLPPITEEEIPFEIPENWEWVKLGNISINIHYGYTASANQSIDSVRLLRITDIQNDRVNWLTVPGCIIELHKVDQYKLHNGDLLIARTGGTIGKTYIVENISVCSVFASYLIRIIPSTQLFPKFLKYFSLSPLYWKQLYDKTSGTGQPNVNGVSLSNIILSLPPLSEQKRIVEKVDQLMALCDKLEAEKEKRDRKRIILNTASLSALTNSATQADFNVNWKHITDNFNTLYSVSGNVKKLKETILQLAVQGKLVPQDPNDEPASVLLQKIKAEKEKLIKEKKIKKGKPLPPITEEEIPFEIPENWEWERIDNFTELVTDGEHQTPPRIDISGIPMGTAKNIRDGFLDMTITDYVSEETAKKCWKRCRPAHNDILMVCVGATTGRLCLTKEPPDFILVRSVALIRLTQRGILPEYLSLAINSPLGNTQVWANVKQSAQPCLYIGKIKGMYYPIPPFAEQKRIVEKVDQLMALCDKLEENLTKSQHHSEKLINSILYNSQIVR